MPDDSPDAHGVGPAAGSPLVDPDDDFQTDIEERLDEVADMDDVRAEAEE